MLRLSIHHRTAYRFDRPVALNPHRLLLRPRESRAVRLTAHSITIDPVARIDWADDVWGNAVATASIAGETDRLTIDMHAMVELAAEPWPVFPIAAEAISYPFRYSDTEWNNLGSLARPSHADHSGRLSEWARAFVLGHTTDTLSLLKDMNAGIRGWASYESRDDEGTQGPLETLERGTGSCRDFSTLLVDALRILGFGARIVSGYLHDPDHLMADQPDAGSTHAWVEVYLPGAGWVALDPTNGAIGGYNLIPVAVAPDIDQLAPVAGSFASETSAGGELIVEVVVREIPLIA